MLLVAPGANIFDALAQAATQLRAGSIVVGESEIMAPEQQAHLLGEAWDRTARETELGTRFVVLRKDGGVQRFSLGAHAPDLSPSEIDWIHSLWVDAVKSVGPQLHHRDVVTAALATLEAELKGTGREEAIERLRQRMSRQPR